MAQEVLGRPVSLFPGTYPVKVNNTVAMARVKPRALTELHTGTLVAKGHTEEYYYVLDESNKQLNYSVLGKPLSFFPGRYSLRLNNSSRKAEVFAGEVQEVATGNLLVKGLTDEYYYVIDTLGNAMNYQTLNRTLAFFPGKFQVRLNNTLAEAIVAEGQTVEFLTGSLMLTGVGSEYYYVFDDSGTQLNYNSLNKSLSFFPSEYSVRLSSSTRQATVMAGKLTSMSMTGPEY